MEQANQARARGGEGGGGLSFPMYQTIHYSLVALTGPTIEENHCMIPGTVSLVGAKLGLPL